MEAMRSSSWFDNDTPRYRLDLRLGIPHSRMQGAIEWWVGDPGLCRNPDRHPYLILAEIAAQGWDDQQDVMQAVARCAEESGPILVSINPVPNMHLVQEISSYQVFPSPGLRSFLLLLSSICQVIIPPGSFAESIARGTPAHLAMDDEAAPPRQLTGRNRVEPDAEEGGSAIVPSLKKGRDDPVLIVILRIVLRRDGIPLAEYDLYGKEWLDSSITALRKNARLSLRKFRIGKGYQMNRSQYREGPQIYVISDLHLGHANSIPRYKRPFLLSDPGEMDRVLIRNWNWTVKENDAVIFLGDLSYMSPKPPESYLGRLCGSIFYLKGNHDPCYPYMSNCLLMRYKGVPYLFIHDPEEVVRPFEGWVIHGHLHNRDISRYPFFNPHTRMVNVSAEMIGYRPILLEEIHDLILETDEVIPFRDLSPAEEIPRDIPAARNCRLPARGCDVDPI